MSIAAFETVRIVTSCLIYEQFLFIYGRNTLVTLIKAAIENYEFLPVEGRTIVTILNLAMIIDMKLVLLLATRLIHSYTFYPSKCKHPIRYGIFCIFLKITFVITLGCVYQLYEIQRILILMLFVYEYIRTIVLVRKLTLLLYQRYFDAYFHEYQHSSVVAYHRQCYQRFKMASIFYIIYSTFRLLHYLNLNLSPIIHALLNNYKFLIHALNISQSTNDSVSWDNLIFVNINHIAIPLIPFQIVLESSFHTLPYLFVTLAYIFKAMRGAYISRNFTFRSDLIKHLLIKNNSAYLYHH